MGCQEHDPNIGQWPWNISKTYTRPAWLCCIILAELCWNLDTCNKSTNLLHNYQFLATKKVRPMHAFAVDELVITDHSVQT